MAGKSHNSLETDTSSPSQEGGRGEETKGRGEVISAIKRHFERAGSSYDTHAEMQRLIADRLTDLIVGRLPSRPLRVLEVGCGTGLLTRRLLASLPMAELSLNDLASGVCARLIQEVEPAHPNVSFRYLPGDAECEVPFPLELDMVASASTIQWFAQLDRFFDKVSSALRPSTGLFAFNTFGPRNYHEIRSLTGQGLCYPPAEELEKWLSTRFRIETHEEVVTTQWFDSPMEVLHHIRQTGVSLATDFRWSKSRLEEFDRRYRAFYTNQGKVSLTWHILYYLCRGN